MMKKERKRTQKVPQYHLKSVETKTVIERVTVMMILKNTQSLKGDM